MAEFERTFHARWGDMDFNAHLRNTAFLDMSGDARMMYFQEHGFGPAEFSRLGIGPVIMEDTLQYRREFHLLEPIRVTLVMSGASPDGKRFRIRNRFYKPDGELAATVTSSGGWLDLSARKFVVPPEALKMAMDAMPRDEDFATL
jgi:acyl-CoA thioester hydrolase